MTMSRGALVLVLWGFAAQGLSAQDVITFRGKVVVVGDEIPTQGLTVHVDGFGSTVTKTNGLFEIALPEGTSTVHVDVELPVSRLVVRHPLSTVSIPADQSIIIEIVVGKSNDAIIADAFARANATIQATLDSTSVQQDQILKILRAFRAEFAERSQIEEDSLAAAGARATQRAQRYPVISAVVEDYLLETRDLMSAFTFQSELAFTNPDALAELASAIRDYNDAYEALNNNRNGYERQVQEYWESETMAAEVAGLFDYARDEIHRLHIFQLNEVLVLVNQINHGALGQTEEADATTRASIRIEDTLKALNVRVQIFEDRKNRIMRDLFK